MNLDNNDYLLDACHNYSGGLESEREYPYEGADETCKFKKSEASVFINSSVAISSDETSE